MQRPAAVLQALKAEFRKQPLVLHNYAGLVNQKRQEAQFRRREINRPTVDRKREIEEVEDERADPISPGAPGRVEAPERRDPHARCEIVGSKRTRQVIRVRVQNGDAVGFAELPG